MSVDPGWIDRLFVWVKDDNWPTVALILIVVVLGTLLYRTVRRQLQENDYCWELYAQSQKEILELTEFVIEGIGLARAPRTKGQQAQLAALEAKLQQFKQQKELDYQRDQDARRARHK